MGGIIKGVGDLVLGKKDPGQAAQTIDMNSAAQNATQNKLMGQFEGMANQDFSAIAQNQIAQQESQARQNVQDQEARARQMVAQRGLGNTSIGMNAILGQGKSLGSDIAKIRAGQPGLEQQLRSQNLSASSQGINAILGQQQGAKIYQPGVASQGRGGGLLSLGLGALGTVGGGSIPGMGAAGGKLGMGMGKEIANIF